MSRVRIVSLAALRNSLATVLADQALLRLRFERALASRDVNALDNAFRCLQLYAPEIRHRVEDTIADWLFADQPAPIATLEEPGGGGRRTADTRVAVGGVAPTSACQPTGPS